MTALVHLLRGDAPACPEPGEQAEVSRHKVKHKNGDTVEFVQTQYWMSVHLDELTCEACKAILTEEQAEERAAAERARAEEEERSVAEREAARGDA